MDVGCYCVHATRHLAGEPERVHGEAVTNEAGVDVRFVGTMRLPGGVLAEFDSGLDVPVSERLEVVGELGTIFLPDPWHGFDARIELRRGGGLEEIGFEPADSYGLELENLSDAILGEAEPLLGRADSLAQARTIEACRRAAESGEPVFL
jgi:predicted dehydrogenase